MNVDSGKGVGSGEGVRFQSRGDYVERGSQQRSREDERNERWKRMGAWGTELGKRKIFCSESRGERRGLGIGEEEQSQGISRYIS